MEIVALVISVIALVFSIYTYVKQRHLESYEKKRSILKELFVVLDEGIFSNSRQYLVDGKQMEKTSDKEILEYRLDVNKWFSETVYTDYIKVVDAIRQIQYYDGKLIQLFSLLKESQYDQYERIQNEYISDCKNENSEGTKIEMRIVPVSEDDEILDYKNDSENLDLSIAGFLRLKEELREEMEKEIKHI